MKHTQRDSRMLEREERVIEFIRDNPYCTKDKIITKGRIQKSSATDELIEKLISEKKIKMLHTKTGKELFTVDHSNLQKFFEYELDNLEYELSDLAKKVPKTAGLLQVFSTYSRLRLKILKYDSKSGEASAGIYSTAETLLKIFEFIENPTVENHTKLLNFLESEIQRDEYFWRHERHASGDSRRSLDNLLEIRSKPHKFRLKNRDYKTHMKKIPNNPNKLFDRWFAEMLRSDYNNSENVPKLIIKRKIRDRLKAIKNDSSKSHNYELEIKNLELLSELLKKMSIAEIINDSKYGSEFLLRSILGEKYEEKMKKNYSPDWMRKYLENKNKFKN